MTKYIIKRILFGILTLWIVLSITFVLVHSIPGGPFDAGTIDKSKFSDFTRQQLIKSYGLDKPYYEQYTLFFKKLIVGDLGVSITYSPRTVLDILKREVPVTMKLNFVSLCIFVSLGLLCGIIAALKQGKWQDNFMRVFTAIGITVPGFVLAIVLIYIFSVKLKWFPVMGLKVPKAYVLPAIAMALSSIAYLSRLVRSSLLDVIRQDYIRTAKAKGLSKRVVIFKHALKNIMIPVLSWLGPAIAWLFIGSFVIEKIFSIPGVGSEMVSSIQNRDYVMVMGLTAFYGALMVLTYILVDIAYVLVDPRIKINK